MTCQFGSWKQVFTGYRGLSKIRACSFMASCSVMYRRKKRYSLEENGRTRRNDATI